MPAPFHVVITDFLTDDRVEAPVLGDIARITLAQAHNQDELAGLVEDADALFVFHELPTIGDAVFERTPKCRGVVRGGVGFNNVDIVAAGRRGIAVCNIPDYGTEEVADHAIMLLLAVARHLIPSHESIRAGGWDYLTAQHARRLRGQTLGVVGCGRIGAATALRAKAFGMDVLFYDPNVPPGHEKMLGLRRADSLDDLLRQSPYVTIHSYLDERTHHLIDARALSLMPRGSILINTARGPIVDQEALLAALDSGQLMGAGLDVVEREPLDDDRLRAHPHVVLTPHSAFYSIEGFEELRRKGAEEVRRLLLGEPPRCLVNRAHLVEPRTAIG